MESQDKLFDYLRRAAADLQETRQRLRELEAGERTPVAIVGMGCRFPGGVREPEEFWDLVAAGTDAVSGFPADRGWETTGQQEASFTRQGGFVYDAADFDARFFGISPREALAMHPQQRMMLEVCWEALERAGIDPWSLRGSLTGVFAGAAHSGYGTSSPEDTEGFAVTGSATSVVSGRVSYVLGLEGPAVTVDTACSSSLVALHLAAQALRSGECDLALAGGVTVMTSPAGFVEFSRLQGLAADGRCKAFSAAADGTGWAEGTGMLVLERLPDARRNGHDVLAVVAGSAVNQDGASNGLTAPNGPSQQRVIRAALAAARLSADQVDAVEAHGTGTVLGDPIEAQALIATYGQDRPPGRPLWLGSVKSNIGHAQQAAGVAGVMKMVLALRHGLLPRTLHADEPSPHVDWSAGDVRLLTEPVPWPAGDRPRLAGVSSFGVSGTNAHVILGEPAAPDDETGPAGTPGPAGQAPALGPGLVAWLVSGRTAEARQAQAGRLADWVAARPGLDPAEVGWSLATSRSMFEHRAVITGAGRAELAAGLAGLAAGETTAGVVTGAVPAGDPGRVVFVFPGQGGQWAGMGRELAASSPVFAARLAECRAALAPFTDWDLHEVLAADTLPDRADVVQPALWAVMVALAATWQAAGVTPDAVVGHSQGEIAAAAVAGVLSLEDAARVVALRSQALTVLAGRGGMAAVAEAAVAVRDRIAPWQGRLSVAAVNGPEATVVSGEPQALGELVVACEAAGVRARVLPVDYASHSVQVEQIRDEILAALGGITPGPAAIPMISALTGQWLEGPGAGPEYWYESLRAPVEFEAAVRELARAGHRVFVEVSPHPVLTAAVTGTLEAGRDGASGGETPAVTGTLRRDDGGPGRFLVSLAQVHVQGVPVDWAAILAGGRRAELPTYAFRHERFWPRPGRIPVTGGGDPAAEAGFWTAVEHGDVTGLAGALAVGEHARLDQVLPALASWRQRQRQELVTGGWRYRAGWVPLPDRDGARLSGTWLVVVPADPAGDLADGCVRLLASRGAQVVVLAAGAGTGRRALAAGIGGVAAGPGGVCGVLSLLALDETPAPGHPVVPAGLAGTLELLQALGDAGVSAPLWVLTSGAVAAGEAEAVRSPAQAMAWGLGRVAGLEHPDRWGGLVDVPPVLDERSGRRLCQVLAGCGEDQAAVRPAGIVVRRLIRAVPRRAPSRDWAPRGTVLVTGATGTIGPYLARWLARRGTPRLALVSRSGPAADGAAALAAALAQAGTAVTVAAADITERAQIHALLTRISTSPAPLSAVLHATVGGELEPLAQASAASLAAGLGAKAAGAAVLDELTAGLSLDAFVLFSSIAGVWGSSAHGTYAAANAYLDALATARRARGLPGTSVAWGVWDAGWAGGGGGGPVADGLRRQGHTFLNPERALAVLDQALADGETFLAVADVDWARFAPVYRAARPWRLFEEIAEARVPSAVPAARPAGDGRLSARLAGLPAGERERVVLDLVQGHAAAVLGHASAEAVEPGRAFRDLGFDSLTAVELRDRLNAATGLGLPSTVVFDYPSAVALARQVTRLTLGTADAPPAAARTAAAGEPVAVVSLGCRFPGGADSPEELWELLAAGGDAIGALPANRGWDLEALYHPDPDHPGTSYTSQGGFLRDAAGFDAGFFGISPREALAMDPQQRLLLEVCWEAVERAGIDPASLRGSAAGVFAG
ncbi:MAG TPA: type I polyketide synthase, partial [Streptosporangiaceae bacterium]